MRNQNGVVKRGGEPAQALLAEANTWYEKYGERYLGGEVPTGDPLFAIQPKHPAAAAAGAAAAIMTPAAKQVRTPHGNAVCCMNDSAYRVLTRASVPV
jgi:hypothetical protein